MGTVMLSGIDDNAIDHLRYWAMRQKLTPGEYVARLVDLHADLRRVVDTETDLARLVAERLSATGLRT
jgi:hypothetical protein